LTCLLDLCVPPCRPRPVRRSVPSFPPVGPGSPVPHARRYYEGVRLLHARPGRLRSPSTARYLSAECPFVPLASAFNQPGPGPLLSGAPCLLGTGGDGRSPRFLENPCESVPRARDSGGSQRPRRIGRPDAVFRQANGVDRRHGKRFRSCTLAARFLAASASPPPVARREARLATGLPATALAGLDSHQLDSFERFPSAHVDFPLSQA
jgi:hypothetical protein